MTDNYSDNFTRRRLPPWQIIVAILVLLFIIAIINL